MSNSSKSTSKIHRPIAYNGSNKDKAKRHIRAKLQVDTNFRGCVEYRKGELSWSLLWSLCYSTVFCYLVLETH